MLLQFDTSHQAPLRLIRTWQMNLLADSMPPLHPQALKEANARLEAHQAIQLAQAFFPPGHMVDTWRAISKLNTLRNEIAHKLVKKESLAEKIEAWVRSAPTGAKDFDDATTRFEFTLWGLFEAVSSLVDDSDTWGFDKKSYGESESAA
jgi:hypothetical protein